MNYLKALFITLLLPFFSFAQSNFKPGYVVTVKGDTIKGFIDYKDWAQNPKKVNFKADINSNQVDQYTLNNVSAFAVINLEYYKKFVLPISTDYVSNMGLPTGIDTSKKTGMVFLRVLNTGKHIILYSYTDEIKERFFISDNNQQPFELIYHRFIKPDQSGAINTIETYKHQLINLAYVYQQGNNAVLSQIQNTTYSENSLSDITTKINGGDAVKNTLPDRQGLSFFVGIGINQSQVNFKDTYSSFASYSKSSTTIFPEINLGLDLYINKNVGRLIFRTELNFTGNKNKFTFSGVTNNQSEFNYSESVKFDQYIVTLNPQFLYSIYQTAKTKIYIDLGGAVNYGIYTNKEDNVTSFFGAPSTESNLENFPNAHKLFLNLTSKVLVSIGNKVQIYAGYNTPVSIAFRNDYDLKLSTYKAGINYFFGTK